MAGKKQQQAPKQQFSDPADDGDAEGWDNGADVDTAPPEEALQPARDWRDVEKYREMRELRRLVGDEFDFTDVLGEIRVRPKSAGGAAPVKSPAAPAAPMPKAAPKAKVPPPKPAAKVQSKAVHKPVPKHAAKPAHKAKLKKPPAKKVATKGAKKKPQPKRARKK
jgi:hypothetical protein